MGGKAWKFGDDVNTDLIIPARYLNTSDPQELASHCMEGADPDFAAKVSPGDVIVGGKNFGCGSSREHAPIAIRHAGIACVVAENFARIFFRNSINTGLPIVESAKAARWIEAGDEVEADLASGKVRVKKPGGEEREFECAPFPDELREIISAGGLMERVKQRLGKAQRA